MEKEHTHKEIELRSEEVQEVMNRVPAWILRSGITVLFVIVVALVAGSYWFKYPDVIAAEVTVSTQDPPAYVVSRAAGRLENLYVQNGQEVGSDTNLGTIELVRRMYSPCKSGCGSGNRKDIRLSRVKGFFYIRKQIAGGWERYSRPMRRL